MSDPYTPVERECRLTGRALEVIAEYQFPVHIITKSDLVVRDSEVLREINRVLAVVSFSLTTTDDDLARIVEPGAPSPSRRLQAIADLRAQGIHAGITMMPLLPFLTDSEDNLTRIIQQAHDHGAKYILPSFGMTLRDRQRAYYYDRLDQHFPGLRAQYEQRFGERYSAPANNVAHLQEVFYELCAAHGIKTEILLYSPPTTALQPRLL